VGGGEPGEGVGVADAGELVVAVGLLLETRGLRYALASSI
jgi:hypothetical protein